MKSDNPMGSRAGRIRSAGRWKTEEDQRRWVWGLIGQLVASFEGRWRSCHAVLVTILVVPFCVLHPAAGLSEPIPIGSIEELQKIGNDEAYPLNGKYYLTNDIDASDTINWNDGKGFAPIRGYSGTWDNRPDFDGRGYTVRNLFINRPTEDNVGLLGSIGISEIKNLGVEGGTIIGRNRVGGLVGLSDEGSLTNCYASVSVEGNSLVGGLIGTFTHASMTRCYATGLVKGSGVYVGGLVGAHGFTSSSECYATGDVVSTGSYVGGLAGHHGIGSMSRSYATGSVTGVQYVGGLVGSSGSGSLYECYAIGDVTGETDVGGLVGWDASGLRDCYAKGAVTGVTNVGGLIGRSNYGVLSGYSTGTVAGNSRVGGLIGWAEEGIAVRSFWDVETSGLPSSDGGTGLPSVSMKRKSTFLDAEWDFENVWTIFEGIGYPHLGMGPDAEQIASDLFLLR